MLLAYMHPATKEISYYSNSSGDSGSGSGSGSGSDRVLLLEEDTTSTYISFFYLKIVFFHCLLKFKKFMKF